MAPKKRLNASKPPADAPIPTIGKTLRSLGGATGGRSERFGVGATSLSPETLADDRLAFGGRFAADIVYPPVCLFGVLCKTLSHRAAPGKWLAGMGQTKVNTPAR